MDGPQSFVVALELQQAELGTAEWLDVELAMDREIPPTPPDTRRLALRLENVALVPRTLATPKLAAALLGPQVAQAPDRTGDD
jgi:hypothetical protein